MTNRLHRVKLKMLLIASLFGAVIGGRELTIALTATEPTRFEARDFADHYDGQKWIEVGGELAIQHAYMRPSTNRAHAGKGLAYVHVPVVPRGWEPNVSVALLATFGPLQLGKPLPWQELAGPPPTIRGQIRPVPLGDLDTRFPGLHFADPPVVVNVGTEPSPPIMMGGFTLLMLLTALACTYGLRREPQPGTEP